MLITSIANVITIQIFKNHDKIVVFCFSRATIGIRIHLRNNHHIMKISTFKYFLIPLCLLMLSTQCDENSEPLSKEEQLISLKTEIENLANTSICDGIFECKFIAFGSKSCGGPKSYLMYSTSIDTEQLESLVETYNQNETQYNTENGIFSDCSIVIPPTSVNCENNTCVPVY